MPNSFPKCALYWEIQITYLSDTIILMYPRMSSGSYTTVDPLVLSRLIRFCDKTGNRSRTVGYSFFTTVD